MIFQQIQLTDFQFEQYLTSYGIYLSTFLISFISGLIPVFNVELFLLALAVLIDKSQFFSVALLSALGQMLAKVLMYFIGKGTIKISLSKNESKFQKILALLKKWQSHVHLIIFASAFTGFPPFYLISIAAGMIRVNFIYFFMISFIGRGLRFGFLIYFPQYFKKLLL